MDPGIQAKPPAAPVLILAGPTASGKSELALVLAERLGGEIVSVDSMQVYRGMDIGTAKPSPRDRSRIPHHLVDVVEPWEPFDAARFVALARRALQEIAQRGRVAILCGGTGLYFKALALGLGQAPGPEPALRAQLEATPLTELLRELADRDPVTFARIDRKNPRRVIRAVEVIRLTGRPYSEQRAAWHSVEWPPSWRQGMFGLRRAAEDLRRRIDLRVDQMFAAGLVEETRGLLARGLSEKATALQALGYRQVVEYLQGRRSLPETVAEVKRRTRQFARRQMTWFRLQMPLEWLEVQPQSSAAALAEQVLARWTLAAKNSHAERSPEIC
ncbi:MAG: tRNA (adenosine(37)-N6)-dimethylallyltransferase MiaA [Verrucomicrobiota bacterium]|nr:tRNA (adenosine(37)-N6)-dimethylallyltransferase MiaA [Limisphaera sp.]MDW8381947.1 tRNA (adenosine(37)-N6)-dimethylallyltransferase MiaA [Verrucomicrobiota bacterium]